MLSRKKTRTELSKPGEVQGKYVKKETSPCRPYHSHKRREKKKQHPKNNSTATSSDLTVISFYFLHSFINNT